VSRVIRVDDDVRAELERRRREGERGLSPAIRRALIAQDRDDAVEEPDEQYERGQRDVAESGTELEIGRVLRGRIDEQLARELLSAWVGHDDERIVEAESAVCARLNLPLDWTEQGLTRDAYDALERFCEEHVDEYVASSDAH